MLNIAHERNLAEALDHRVVVDKDHGLVTVDLRDCLPECGREMETVAGPIAREVLHATIEGSVLVNQSRTTDADEGRDVDVISVRAGNQFFEHADELPDRFVAAKLVIGVPPQFQFPDFRLREVFGLLQIEVDDTGPDIGAADVDGENRLMTFENPARRQMRGSDQSSFIRIVVNARQLDVDVVCLEQHGRAADGDFADAAAAQSSADHHAFRIAPALQLEETADHLRQLFGKRFDSAMDHAGG